jgi:ABC-type dipeptide/oligopeptide/nickel transport system ATPase component
VSILSISGLHIDLRTPDGPRAIVAGIDLILEKGRIHGLAGESGSGKTMTALAILGLLPDSMTASGSIALVRDGGTTELLRAPQQVLAGIRGRRVAMVFQDPSMSLHPQLSVGRQLTDHMRHHLKFGKQDARARAIELLDRVSVPDPACALRKFPHQFSGGQRQRIAIAVALACDPDVLLADEPTTALDVTVQAGVLQLLRGLVDESGLSVLLVTHDLGVMSAVADEVTVMRSGLVVESAPRRQLFTTPQHEYTKSLLAALPGSTLEESPDVLVKELLSSPSGADAATDARESEGPA